MLRKQFIAQILGIAATLCIGISTASANVVFNDREPFEFSFFNACTGEDVFVSGIFHSVVREKFREDGSSVVNVSISAHGYGVGQTSGAEYVWNDSAFRVIEGTPGSFSNQSTTFIRLIGKGNTPNELFESKFLLEVVFDPFEVNVEFTEDFRCLPN